MSDRPPFDADQDRRRFLLNMALSLLFVGALVYVFTHFLRPSWLPPIDDGDDSGEYVPVITGLSFETDSTGSLVTITDGKCTCAEEKQ